MSGNHSIVFNVILVLIDCGFLSLPLVSEVWTVIGHIWGSAPWHHLHYPVADSTSPSGNNSILMTTVRFYTGHAIAYLYCIHKRLLEFLGNAETWHLTNFRRLSPRSASQRQYSIPPPSRRDQSIRAWALSLCANSHGSRTFNKGSSCRPASHRRRSSKSR